MDGFKEGEDMVVGVVFGVLIKNVSDFTSNQIQIRMHLPKMTKQVYTTYQ